MLLTRLPSWAHDRLIADGIDNLWFKFATLDNFCWKGERLPSQTLGMSLIASSFSLFVSRCKQLVISYSSISWGFINSRFQ